jgi:hypothetical protein
MKQVLVDAHYDQLDCERQLHNIINFARVTIQIF